jgi:hypothetical protein
MDTTSSSQPTAAPSKENDPPMESDEAPWQTVRRKRCNRYSSSSETSSTHSPQQKISKGVSTTTTAELIPASNPLITSTITPANTPAITLHNTPATTYAQVAATLNTVHVNSAEASTAITDLTTFQLTNNQPPSSLLPFPEVAATLFYSRNSNYHSELCNTVTDIGANKITTVNLSSTHTAPRTHILINTPLSKWPAQQRFDLLPKSKVNLEIFISDLHSITHIPLHFLLKWSLETNSSIFFTFPTCLSSKIAHTFPAKHKKHIETQLGSNVHPFRIVQEPLSTT